VYFYVWSVDWKNVNQQTLKAIGIIGVSEVILIQITENRLVYTELSLCSKHGVQFRNIVILLSSFFSG